MKNFILIMALLTTLGIPSIIRGAEGSDSSVYEMREYKIGSHGKSKLSLKTKWRDDEMYYIFTIMPVDKKKVNALTNDEEMYGGFHILMVDKDGFNIIDIPVVINDFSLLAESSEIIAGFEANDSVPCSLATYKTLDSWQYSYTLDIFIDAPEKNKGDKRTKDGTSSAGHFVVPDSDIPKSEKDEKKSNAQK